LTTEEDANVTQMDVQRISEPIKVSKSTKPLNIKVNLGKKIRIKKKE